MKPLLHVEVVQKKDSNILEATLHNYVRAGLEAGKVLTPCSTFHKLSDELLSHHVESIHICELPNESDSSTVKVEDYDLKIYTYKLEDDGVQVEGIASGDGDGQEVSAALHWVLPSRDFHGLWDYLVFDSNIRHNLLQCLETTLLFSDCDVSANVITWNRVILLHGPPGTGKTSLCKALAQKLAIRFSKRYTHGQLLEINSHSLFSKWFSESGKLVMRMFAKVRELVENPNALVIVLIDEVESLTHARNSQGSGEPSDSIRTVNAVLTQIDNLKKYPNVLIMATSNLSEAIDLAFLDRADIKQYIGPPSVKSIYKIHASCIIELSRTNIIAPREEIFSYDTVIMKNPPLLATNSLRLLQIARDCEGMNGRTLRKLPYLAHALFIQRPSCSLEEYLEALSQAVKKHKDDTKDLNTPSNNKS